MYHDRAKFVDPIERAKAIEAHWQGRRPRPSRPSLSDMNLWRKAMRQGWAVPRRERFKIIRSLMNVLDDSKWPVNDKPTTREIVAAATTLVLADQCDIEAERREHESGLATV